MSGSLHLCPMSADPIIHCEAVAQAVGRALKAEARIAELEATLRGIAEAGSFVPADTMRKYARKALGTDAASAGKGKG